MHAAAHCVILAVCSQEHCAGDFGAQQWRERAQSSEAEPPRIPYVQAGEEKRAPGPKKRKDREKSKEGDTFRRESRFRDGERPRSPAAANSWIDTGSDRALRRPRGGNPSSISRHPDTRQPIG